MTNLSLLFSTIGGSVGYIQPTWDRFIFNLVHGRSLFGSYHAYRGSRRLITEDLLVTHYDRPMPRRYMGWEGR